MDQFGLGQSDLNVSLLPDQFNLLVVSSITQWNRMVAVQEFLDWIPNLMCCFQQGVDGKDGEPGIPGVRGDKVRIHNDNNATTAGLYNKLIHCCCFISLLCFILTWRCFL